MQHLLVLKPIYPTCIRSLLEFAYEGCSLLTCLNLIGVDSHVESCRVKRNGGGASVLPNNDRTAVSPLDFEKTSKSAKDISIHAWLKYLLRLDFLKDTFLMIFSQGFI